MKTFALILALAFTMHHPAQAQLVPCRPKLCMIVYEYHNDNVANAVKPAIQSFLPEILIDNTPGGLYGQQNGGVGCIPSNYTSLGTEVFCYLTGGYEGTKYVDTRDNLQVNLARITAIDNDGATGVFLDEVSNMPDPVEKAYITAIWNQCQSLGLKLILNPGTSVFDSWLMGRCDYIMTDENYNGTRLPSSAELPYLSRVLVVTQGVTSAATAATVTLGARANGFGYSYACDSYIHTPNYLAAYRTAITQPPATPTIAQMGNNLQSSASFGNQWYDANTGMPITGATGKNYTPTTSGTYYSIVTLQGCSSDTSNVLSFVSTDIRAVGKNGGFLVYPNPSSGIVTVSFAKVEGESATLEIVNGMGKLVRRISITTASGMVDVQNLSDGVYHFSVKSKSGVTKQTHIISR